MKPHKHAELIKQWADGADIQLLDDNGTWMDFREGDTPAWNPTYQYRVKPKPDVVEEFSVYRNAYWALESERQTDRTFKFQPIYLADMRLTWDGETGKLKSAEIL